ncbi:MAG: hypothetical protein KA146_01595 [Leptospiraceae bacterium]|nr:hypothetical protein [Leptospiraceae bacterium]
MEKQLCQICLTEIPFQARYPNYLCEGCSSRAVSKNGRTLLFENIDLSGGFSAFYADTREEYEQKHICYVDSKKCWADEHKFGGIVIETIDPLICPNLDCVKSNIIKIKCSAQRFQNWLNNSMKENPLSLFYDLKFKDSGYQPFYNERLNFIEQLNQTFSNLVVFLGVDYLIKKFGEQIYHLNIGTNGGFDIYTEDKSIVAEAFSVVDPSNNRKLKKDITKLSSQSKSKKYIFYYSHNHPEMMEKIENDIQIVQFGEKELIECMNLKY